MSSLVSIITPSYNSEMFIKECIESVISQTYKEWELIIVDDCSSDATRQIIQQFSLSDKRIKTVFLEENLGPAKARNIAIDQAKGRYIAFLDSDDLWVSSKLEKQLDFMKTNNIAFSFSEYEVISENGDKVLNLIRVPNTINYYQYLRNTIIGCLTVIIDREQTGPFSMRDIRSSHDMSLWLDLMKRGFVAYGIQDCLAKYRLVKASNTSRKMIAAYDVWIVYRKIEKLNLFYSFYCFIGYVFNAVKKRL